ncbi:MAG: endonuclease/exonuclease/phosphatase family protein [Gammaproteobacteria bacterium]
MMKLVTYNIQYGKGLDGQVDLDRIADEIHGADIIALQEVERFWPRTGNVDQVAELYTHFNDYYWAYGAGVDLHVEGSTPQAPRRRQFGNMLLSRFPLLYSRHHLLPKYGSTGPLSIQRSAIEASIHIGDFAIRFYSVHLTHLSAETRLPQIEKLLDIHQKAQYEGAPVSGNLSGMDLESGVDSQQVPDLAIMMGDFNFQPDSREYNRIIGPISDYGGHVSNPVGLVDAWCECGNDKMDGKTSDVNKVPARLDYCFVSAQIRDRIKSCRVDTTATGSDHRPVWIEIDL